MFLFLSVIIAANGAYLLWALLDGRKRHGKLLRRLEAGRGKSVPKQQRKTPLLALEDSAATSGLERVLHYVHLERRLAALLEQAGHPTDMAGAVRRMAGAAAAGFAAGMFKFGAGSLLLPAVASVACAAIPLWQLSRTARLRLERIEEQLPSCLEFIARSMRAGHGFSVALELIPEEFTDPLASEFRHVWEEHKLGMPLEVALRKMGARVPLLSIRFFVCAVALQKRTGGNLAEILDNLAGIVRERFKLKARVKVISAHGRMTAAALSMIPICVAGLMAVVNRPYMRFFVDDEKGPPLVAAASLMQVTGYLIIRKMVKIEV